MWIFYTVLGVLFFSTTNYIEKFLIDKKIKNPILLTVSTGPVFLVLSLFMLFFIHLKPVTFVQFASLIFAGIFLTLYLIPYYKALKTEETSRLIPLFEFVPIFTLIFAALFLHEHLRNFELIGFFLILLGGILISIKKFDLKEIPVGKPFLLLVLSSLLYSAVPILFKFAVVSVNFSTSFFYQTVGAVVGCLIISFLPANKKSLQKDLRKASFFPLFLLFFLHGLGLLGDLAISFAYFLAPVALVTVVAGTQPFFVLIIGIVLSVWFPHIVEEDLKKSSVLLKIFSIVVIFIGTILVNR